MESELKLEDVGYSDCPWPRSKRGDLQLEMAGRMVAGGDRFKLWNMVY
jgi:hypothetical protein